MELNREHIESIVSLALEEDLGQGDVTTDSLIPDELTAKASIIVKDEGVLAGIGVAETVFAKVDPTLVCECLVEDGARIYPGTVVASISGKAASILKAERVALNFLQHMSGIASQTARYVLAIFGTEAKILDTRKTTPGLRPLEKYAVIMGGGHNHRYNLSDGVLIKDNHFAALEIEGIGLRKGIQRARQNAPRELRIEAEVETINQAREALDGGADILLLDNMKLEDMRIVVKMAQGLALTEASGGITLENLRQVAETGVNFISIGALTHSVKALDFSLEIEFK